MFIYHFVDLDLRVDAFFEKDGIPENGVVDFEIGDIDNSAHLYWRLEKFHASFKRVSPFLLFFLLSSLINEFRNKENIHTKTVVDVSRGAGGRIFLFSWE